MNQAFKFDKDSINVIKGLSIIMIVLFHIHCISEHLQLFVNSMALPAFMFCSGILYNRYTKTDGGGYKQFIFKKFKRLCIPY